MRKKEFLLITQHYQPTKSSGGRLLSKLLPGLVARGLQGSVLSSNRGGGPRHEEIEGLQIRRLTIGRTRKNIVMRGLTELWFAFKVAVWFVFFRRPDLVIIHSSPPFLPYLIGPICKIRRIPYLYILYDLFPDGLAFLGKLSERSILFRAWDRLSKMALRQARFVIVLGRCMEGHINGKFPHGLDNLRIVHNWSDKDKIYPIQKAENHYFRESILPDDKFIVQYSGNIGELQDFDVILRAAAKLKDREDIVFAIIGSGNGAQALDNKIAALGKANIIRLPFQDEALKNDLLNAADVSVITLKEGMEKISMPSKFYPTIAAGIPVISVINANSEIPYILAEENIGANVTDRSGRELADKIVALKDGAIEFSDPREVYLRLFDLDMAITNYVTLINQTLERAP